MEKTITIGVSNRHVHLTKETYDKLFDEEITKKVDLNQLGEFASNQLVTLVANGHEIERVRLLGPLRTYDQVEISHNDALKFKLNPPVRKSGDLTGAEEITLRTEKGEVTIKACILAQRHVHVNTKDADSFGVVDGQKVQVKVGGPRSGIMDAYIKISDNGFYEMHIDTDDANAFMINNDNNEGTLII